MILDMWTFIMTSHKVGVSGISTVGARIHHLNTKHFLFGFGMVGTAKAMVLTIPKPNKMAAILPKTFETRTNQNQNRPLSFGI